MEQQFVEQWAFEREFISFLLSILAIGWTVEIWRGRKKER